jgi:hypothetical protein
MNYPYFDFDRIVDDRMRVLTVLFLKTSIRSDLNFHNENCCAQINLLDQTTILVDCDRSLSKLLTSIL